MDDIKNLSVIPLAEIQTAASVLRDNGVPITPLIPLNYDVPGKKIYLKLENLQPVGSFKIRCATSAIGQLSKDQLRDGVVTCSAGNFGQGLAWSARNMHVPCFVVAPDTAPNVKVDAMRELGAEVRLVPYDTWWSIMESGKYSDVAGTFLHPACDRRGIAGNGTIGLEILDALPDVDTVVCAWGGGGHATGIGSCLQALKPEAKIIACEVETGAPLISSFKAGRPTDAENFRRSFVDGMNGRKLLPSMWNLAKNLITDTVVLSLTEICDAVRLLVARNCVVAEGAGAASVAAALKDSVPDGNIVCVISGGNIQTDVLAGILNGQDPE